MQLIFITPQPVGSEGVLRRPCQSPCVPVCPRTYRKTKMAKLHTKFSLHVAFLFRRRCNALRASGFVDDVIFVQIRPRKGYASTTCIFKATHQAQHRIGGGVRCFIIQTGMPIVFYLCHSALHPSGAGVAKSITIFGWGIIQAGMLHLPGGR